VGAGAAALGPVASETSRIAKALVARRTESFASRLPRAQSEARLAAALATIRPKRLRFASRWRQEGTELVLDAEFSPAPGTQRFLQAASALLVLLIASSAWALMRSGEAGAFAFLVPLTTVLGILGFPFVAAAIGSQREAEEARIRTAIRRALTDRDESGAGRSR
jgi:hypothetical protein